MDEWQAKMKERLKPKIEGGTPHGDAERCILWLGGTRAGYGWVKALLPNGTKKTMNAQRFIYMVWRASPDIPPYHDISHICHNKMCINLAHLTREPHHINMARKQCCGTGICFGHNEQPNCIFLGLTKIYVYVTSYSVDYVAICCYFFCGFCNFYLFFLLHVHSPCIKRLTL